jgi:ABC-2 type transport system permease protein
LLPHHDRAVIRFYHSGCNQANDAFISEILARKDVFVESTHEKPEIGPLEFYAASLIAVFIMFSSIPCVKLIAEERKLGILSRIQAAPAHGWQNIGSKLILSVLISMAQFSVIAVFMSFAAKSLYQIPIAPILEVLMSTVVSAAAFSLLIASIAMTPAAADLVSNLSILLMAVAGGSIYPLSALPEICRKISVGTINRWSAEGFMAVLSGGDASLVSGSCLNLLLLAGCYLILALLFFRLGRRRTA